MKPSALLPPLPKPTLVGPDVLSKLLKVSRNTILNWARSGMIASIRVGKIYRFHLPQVAEDLKIPHSVIKGWSQEIGG